MIDITTLSQEEQLMTASQREELDRRLDELDREGPVGIPAEEVLGRLQTRRA